MDLVTTESVDAAMMARCIELSKTAANDGEFPFACVIARDGKVVVETTNRVARDGDVTRHAEIVAVSMAQKALGTKDLSGCTLYTNVEPCAMCCVPDPRDAHQPRRLCDRVAPDGRGFQVGRARRRRDFRT